MNEMRSLMRSIEPVIQLRELQKSYRRGSVVTPVLRQIDVDLLPGEFTFLAGPSGSGKSTLLSILGCILTPDRGQGTVLGHDIFSLDQHQKTRLRRDRIGFVFQRFQLIKGLTALDNVCVPLALRGDTPGQARQRADYLLELVGLSEHGLAPPETMSAGQCQRVAFARALACDPDLILADEPTASLDAANGIQVVKLLRELVKTQNKTAVVVTHDRRIFPFADRILLLENGRVVDAASPSLASVET
jgi:putative ABC transport system ATP-binding protein